MNKREPESTSLGGRFAAAAAFAFFIGITLLILPIVILFLTRGRLVHAFAMYSKFVVWGPVIVLLAFIFGFILGQRRIVDVLVHIWGTQDPRQLWVTASLWGVLIGMALAINWILAMRS
jgi:cytochrome c biogenesis protein CcdA